MALMTLGLGGCKDAPAPLEIDNSLTAEEIAAGRLTPEVMWKMGRIGSAALSPDGKTLLYTVTRYNMAENRGVTVIVAHDMSDGSSKELTDTSSNNVSPAWNADGSEIWFMSNRSGSMQVWAMDADGESVRQISDIEGGIESFGLAPDGKHIYYTRRVHVKEVKSSDVHKDMPKSKARIYDDLMCRHWDYWDEGDYSHIFIAETDGKSLKNETDIIGGDAAWDTPLAPYFDSDEIAWSPDGRMLAYTCKPLTGTEYAQSTDSDIFVYMLESGATQNICKPVVDGQVRYNGKVAGEMPFVGYDKYPVWSPDGGEVEVVTSGDHDINAFTMAGGRCIAAVTTISMATELFDVDLTSGALTQITSVNKDIYDNIRMGEVRKRWVRTTDGKQMLTWVILPPDFDPAKKYPALLYCQGGPQSVVSQFWSYRWNFQLMAAQGYIVVAPNRRGLPSFGQEWLDQISGDYSGQNIRDYLSAIDDVAKEPWCDENRLGCVGASYGGYSVYYLAGHHDKRFKAFIAHCGIFDFDSMYGETEELFFVNNDYGGNYWDKSNAVAMRSYANSPHKSVDKWDTPILIFTGEYDFRIPYTQSLEAFTAARVRGIPARLVEFEDEAHQVFKPQNSLVWNREFFGWLDKYLK